MNNNKLGLEFLWWIVTAIITAAVLYPITSSVVSYPFLISNAVLIATFITLVRYMFLLPYTFLHGKLYVKGALILVSPIFIFLLIQEVTSFQSTIDEQGWAQFLGISDLTLIDKLSSYIRSEFIFFGVGSAISAFIFPFRLVASIWSVINRT